MLRRDPRTNRLPVGLMAQDFNVEKSERLADRDPLVAAFPRPHNGKSVAFVTKQLTELAGWERIDYDERLDHAEKALKYLEQLARSPKKYSFYDLYRQQPAVESALFIPAISSQAAAVLGLLGTPKAQAALVNLASQNSRPVAEREAALKAFAAATKARGLLLTRTAIATQYTRYNQSEFLDKDTQRILGAILDAIESPRQGNSTQ